MKKPMDTPLEQLDELIGLLPLPVCVVSPKRILTNANIISKKVFPRLSTGENTGQDLAYFSHEPELLEACSKIIEGGGDAVVGIEELGPPKRFFRVNLSGFNETELNKHFVMMLFTDVTLSKESEKSRSAFVANVSHELRSPLTTLMGSIETLQGPAKNDEAARHKFLGLMEQEAARMKRIVDELLTLSKMEIQAHIAPQDKVDLASVLKRTSDVLENQAHRKKMTIKLDVPNSLPKVRGDRDQLIQVFHNLVDNAIKYGLEHTDITIGAKTNDKTIELFVKNIGSVIASEKLPRLTERFYRVDKGRSRDMGGTGLGLAIVKHIVNRHRGSLDIKSTEGDGTIFSIVLPTNIKK
jgi:two-component system phosphate regulon sensor histidine kinase PhoR